VLHRIATYGRSADCGPGIRWVTIGCQIALALPLVLVMGAIAATNVELMPREVRCTGLAFAYNLSLGGFGGLTPMVLTWLTVFLQSWAAPGYWMAAGAAISAITLYTSVDETRETPV
jgi:MHS family proline/betaine transporter-like MFS transporter